MTDEPRLVIADDASCPFCRECWPCDAPMICPRRLMQHNTRDERVFDPYRQPPE